MSPDQLRQAFPEYLHSFMPQFDPTTSYRYDPGKVDKEGYESQAQYKYNYAQPIAAPKFQELPSIDIQKQMGQDTEAEGAEWDRERRGLLRTGAGRNVFGRGRT